jgi:uncharacterized repeat protein (TIGR01451 family)
MKRAFETVMIIFFSVVGLIGQSDHAEAGFVREQLSKSNILVKGLYITDHYTSGGITHTYFKESIGGIPIFNSRGAIHYKDRSSVINNINFKKANKDSSTSVKAKITVFEAIDKVVSVKGLKQDAQFIQLENKEGRENRQLISAPEISIAPIPAKLQYYILDTGELRLAWELAIEDVRSAWYTDYLVDAESGDILEEISWTVECNHGSDVSKECNHTHDHEYHTYDKSDKSDLIAESILVPNTYEVFDLPVESPNFGSRSINTAPWNDNLVASPNGWHTIGGIDYTTTRGNNTDTYLDDDNTNAPTGDDTSRAEGGSNLEFVFPLDVAGDPADYTDAAITNTFFWTNLMHDVWYNYGFDEQSGNFQEENYSLAGLGSDYVQSEVQDGLGACNANFGTPPDGSNPRMQMYLCNGRDGDYDNGVIAHEYGHGISNRLTGGPSAAGCLAGQEQMGEGWSDYLGMVMTIEVGDAEADARTVGTWLFGQEADGLGIRPFPYSTDFGVNPSTYDDIKTFSIPHGVGSVWCTMLWDMTWAFIDQYGFDSDMYNGTGGNNMAMALVMEGMKLQPCRPGFIDGRDAILEADRLLYDGAHELLIWKAFADRGLGFSADQGSFTSRSDGTESFDMPPNLSVTIEKFTSTVSSEELEQITYEISVTNNQTGVDEVDFMLTDSIPDGLSFVSATDGGTESGGIITFPLFDLAALSSKTVEVVLEVDSGQKKTPSDFYDGLESGTGNWNTSQSGNTNWNLQSSQVNDGTFAWFAPNNDSEGEANLDLALSVGIGDESLLSFHHKYDTEPGFDGGSVLISIDDGQSWSDLGHRMIHNGYNSTLGSKSGFSGDSGLFINTIIDLSIYEGQDIKIRFQMICDETAGGNGWWIDDIVIKNLQLNIVNTAAFENGTSEGVALSNSVAIVPSAGDFVIDIVESELLCYGDTDGTISVLASGGSGVYSYSWADGSTSDMRTDLGAGLYRVTVSDGTEAISKIAIVSTPLELFARVNSTFLTNQSENNGTASVLPEGGRAPYSFSWSNGEVTQSIDSLVEGTYSVTVTDRNMCTYIDQVDIRKIDCGDSIYDSGGEEGEYSNNEDVTTLICSPNLDEAIQITFNSLNIESNWDALYIYNGNSIDASQFDSGNGPTQAGFPAGGFYGTDNPGTFTSTDESGCILLRFRSDQFVTGSGFDIDVSCTTLCSDEVSYTVDDGWGSLRRTIECADDGDIVPIDVSLNMDTISLISKIVIDKEIQLDILDDNEYLIKAMGASTIFEITTEGSLSLDKVNLLSGTSNEGGAIINYGTILLNNVNVISNENTPNPSSLILNHNDMKVTGVLNIKGF